MEKITAKIEGSSAIEATVTSEAEEISCTLEKQAAAIRLEKREVIPSNEVQHIIPRQGYGGLQEVTVAAIPQNYGKITYDGSQILVS